MDVKPGWRTSEFWVTIAVLAAVLAGGAGLLQPDDVEQVKTEATSVVGHVTAIIVSAAYIIGRAKVKATNGN